MVLENLLGFTYSVVVGLGLFGKILSIELDIKSRLRTVLFGESLFQLELLSQKPKKNRKFEQKI